MKKPQIIFLGNGTLADCALPVLAEKAEIIFRARTKADLAQVSRLKKQFPQAFAVLASFGVMIPGSLLDEFEPEGILNLHPSLLPKYRGASPIESAILAGDTEFGYSVMRLVAKMDAGPIYHQASFKDLALDKAMIYHKLAEAGATCIAEHLAEIRNLEPTTQDESAATYTEKFAKENNSELKPADSPAWQIYRQIVAFQSFPKPKYQIFGKQCIILSAKLENDLAEEILNGATEVANQIYYTKKRIFLVCGDRRLVEILRLQPEGKRPMDAAGFINGYAK